MGTVPSVQQLQNQTGGQVACLVSRNSTSTPDDPGNQTSDLSPICPSSCQGAISGEVGRARVATPGPGLIRSVEAGHTRHILGGLGPRLADARTGSLSYSWIRPSGRPKFDAPCQAVSLFSSWVSLWPHAFDAWDSRELPVPARVRAPADGMSLCGSIRALSVCVGLYVGLSVRSTCCAFCLPCVLAGGP